ncbi:MAG TPA: transglycosylase SLT domain-containing protein [Microvirga sp.]
MTWQHLLRTMLVAGAATIALALASQARAEGGDESSVYRAAPTVEVASAEPAAPAAEETVADAAETQKSQERIGPAQERVVSRRSPGVAQDAVRAAGLKPVIARYASEHGIPFALADAVVRIESRYNADARNGPNVGLTQINTRTAQSLGYAGPVAGLFDPETNLRFGLKYLAQAYRLAGGDTCGTILRYQAGHRAQTMTKDAQAYCSRVKTIIASAG